MTGTTGWVPDLSDRGETCGVYRRADGEARVFDHVEFRYSILHDARHPPKRQVLSRPKCPNCGHRGAYDGRIAHSTIYRFGIVWSGAVLRCEGGHEWASFNPSGGDQGMRLFPRGGWR